MDAKFVLDTHVSDFSIEAVLLKSIKGEEKVIEYGSRMLTKQEQRYCVSQKETPSHSSFCEDLQTPFGGKEVHIMDRLCIPEMVKIF